MDKKYVMRIAATIQQQLLTMTKIPLLMSWGIEEFAAIVYDGKPALRIAVHARLFQGDVVICLNGADYYEIYLLNQQDVKCLHDEVCFDELGKLIDRAIESGTDRGEYERFCARQAEGLFVQHA